MKANSKRDLKLILTDFNISGVTEDDIYRYYKDATNIKGNALVIDSLNNEIRKNLTGKIYNKENEE